MPRLRRKLPLLIVQRPTQPHREAWDGDMRFIVTMLRGHSPVGRDTSVTSQPCITTSTHPHCAYQPGSAATQSRGPRALGILLPTLAASHPHEQVRDPSPSITDWLRLPRNNLV